MVIHGKEYFQFLLNLIAKLMHQLIAIYFYFFMVINGKKMLSVLT